MERVEVLDFMGEKDMESLIECLLLLGLCLFWKDLCLWSDSFHRHGSLVEKSCRQLLAPELILNRAREMSLQKQEARHIFDDLRGLIAGFLPPTLLSQTGFR